MNTTTVTIGPNKKGVIKFCAILTPILLVAGAILFLLLKGEVISLFYFVHVSAERLGIIAASLSLIPILIMILTMKSKRRIRLDETGITLSDTVSVGWGDISHCNLQSHLGRPYLLNIVRKAGDDLMVSWNHVDCGLEKLADLINEHLPDSEVLPE